MNNKNKDMMLSLMKKNLKYMVISFLIIMSSQLLVLVPPKILQSIIDQYIPNKQISKIYLSIIIFCMIPLIITLINSIFYYYTATIIRKLGFKMRNEVFLNVLKQPLKFFKDSKSGELANYCRDASELLKFFLFDVPTFLSNILIFIVIFLILFKINQVIAIMQLLVIPVIILPAKFVNNAISKYTKNIVELNGKIVHLTNESFEGIKTIKTLGIENKQVNLIESINEYLLKYFGKTIFLERFGIEVTNQCLSYFFIGVSFAYASLLVIKGRLTIGLIVEIVTYLPILFSSIKECISTNFNFNKKLAEYDKSFELALTPNEFTTNSRISMNEFKRSIKFQNVSFSYEDGKPILENLNLEINKNDIVAITGPSGIGKSTIFSLIERFYNITSGNIYIDGVDINDIDLVSLRNRIALCSQDYFLFGSTIRENLLLAKPNANDDEIKNAVFGANLDTVVGNLSNGIDTDIGDNGGKLSGGERQRLALAMALIRDSDVLLLDEISSNLDNESENLIKQSIENLAQKSDKTIVIISHKDNLVQCAKKQYKLNKSV